jgi:hypothetical protein
VPSERCSIEEQSIDIVDGRVLSSDVVRDELRSPHNVTRHNTPLHNLRSTASRLSVAQQALETLPEDDNIMPKHRGTTIHTSN